MKYVTCQSEKFGKLIYITPAEWKLTKYQNGVLIIPAVLPAKEFLGIQIMEPVIFSGTMPEALRECYNKPFTELQVTQMNEWNGTIPAISFTMDGKFNDKGAIRILYHEYVDCLNPALLPGSGTYEVKNHSLIFNYNDGRKIRIAFTESAFDKKNADPSSILTISNNHDVLRRQ